MPAQIRCHGLSLCQTNLDVRQLDVAKACGTRYNIRPSTSRGFGIAPWPAGESLRLNRLIISPKPVLQKLQGGGIASRATRDRHLRARVRGSRNCGKSRVLDGSHRCLCLPLW